MRLRYIGIRPGIVHGEATWQPGDERDVPDDGRAGSPLWERCKARPEQPAPVATDTTKARTRRAMEDR